MVSSRSLLKDKVKRKILARLSRGQSASPSFLPSERVLAGHLGISRTTVRAALAELEAEGLIVRERGRGTRVVRERERHVGTVAVVFGSPGGTTYGGNVLAELFALIEGISLSLGSKGIPAIFCPTSGYESEAMETDASATSAAFAQQLMRRTSAAILVEWQHSAEVAHELEKRGFPCVVANEEENADVRRVRVDFAALGHQAAEYMARCGYDNAVCLVGSRRRFVFGEFCAAFETTWQGHRVRWVECYPRVRSARDGLCDVLRRGHESLAIFAFGDERTLGALESLKEKGLAAPEHVGVMCYGRSRQAVREAGVTGFTEPAADVGRLAVEKLVNLCASRQVERTTVLPAPLVEGRTMFF